ncbi:unannotated protein [freshwater metagenome]|uniref:Unannotated protein n=1 Tax=freshwater metagenome TaxID=449393 RepID=A0A6J7LYH2_9ZZZZ
MHFVGGASEELKHLLACRDIAHQRFVQNTPVVTCLDLGELTTIDTNDVSHRSQMSRPLQGRKRPPRGKRIGGGLNSSGDIDSVTLRDAGPRDSRRWIDALDPSPG